MKKKQPEVLDELMEQGKAALGTLDPDRQDEKPSKSQDDYTAIRQTGKEQMVKVTVRMPEDLVKQLKHRAIDENRTLQDLLIEMARNLIEEEDGGE